MYTKYINEVKTVYAGINSAVTDIGFAKDSRIIKINRIAEGETNKEINKVISKVIKKDGNTDEDKEENKKLLKTIKEAGKRGCHVTVYRSVWLRGEACIIPLPDERHFKKCEQHFKKCKECKRVGVGLAFKCEQRIRPFFHNKK